MVNYFVIMVDVIGGVGVSMLNEYDLLEYLSLGSIRISIYE